MKCIITLRYAKNFNLSVPPVTSSDKPGPLIFMMLMG